MEFKRATLDNGLEIIGEINPKVWSAAIGFFVRTGSRDEKDATAGVSHFLEHMLFKGTARRSAADVNRELDEMGGVSNAFTGEEMTVYYGCVLPELQTRLVDLLADMMRPALRRNDFETEKKVILEEISMYLDQPPYGVDEKCRELFFGDHPLARSVLGTSETIAALTVEQMRDYFEARYTPGNITAVVCGCVDFEQFVRDVNERCGAWHPCESPRKSFRPKGASGNRNFVRANSTQQYVFSLVDAPSTTDDDRYAAAILANILGDDAGSRLFWELVDNGRADSCQLSYCDFIDAGFFLTSLCCEPGVTNENRAIIAEVYRRAATEGITSEELQRAKNKLLSRLVFGSERSTGRLFAVGGEWTQTRTYFPLLHDLEIVRNMTLDAITNVMNRYPLADPLTVAVGPLTGGGLGADFIELPLPN